MFAMHIVLVFIFGMVATICIGALIIWSLLTDMDRVEASNKEITDWLKRQEEKDNE